jgi:GNAT superfamily N-acetyltransferase
MPTLNVEKFQDFKDEVYRLWHDHWEEIATDKDKIPLDPDVGGYEKLQNMGGLLCITCRDGHQLVGYAFMLVFPHLHYKSTKYALNDILYLDPKYRRGFTGVKLIKRAEEECRVRGVKKIIWHIKTDHNFGKIMEHLGYNLFEVNYGKYIGE